MRLSLSGEVPSKALLSRFKGVGLIRSEYVIRRYAEFITVPSSQKRLAEYVATIAELTVPQPVWYRTTEMTTQEANTLKGVDKVFHEADFMKGRRGTRRGLELPESMLLELKVVAEVACAYPNLHVLFPFVRDADDLGFCVDLLNKVAWPNRFGSMIEIPSALLCAARFIEMGASNLLLGLNDLSSLLTGTSRVDRDMKDHPSVEWALSYVAEAAGPGREWGIAGNFNQESAKHLLAADKVPYISVHYAELPGLMGIPVEELPDRGLVGHVKRFTRDQIQLAEECRWREILDVKSVL